MNITQRDRDLGTAYAMRPSATRTELTEVGRGTPMGELLRRYWHPMGLAGDATDVPRKVRALGEDLILFRDRHGRIGLLHARAAAATATPRSTGVRGRTSGPWSPLWPTPLFAAVGRGHHHARRAVVRLAGGVHSGRYQAGVAICDFHRRPVAKLPSKMPPAPCRRNHFGEPAKPS